MRERKGRDDKIINERKRKKIIVLNILFCYFFLSFFSNKKLEDLFLYFSFSSFLSLNSEETLTLLCFLLLSVILSSKILNGISSSLEDFDNIMICISKMMGINDEVYFEMFMFILSSFLSYVAGLLITFLMYIGIHNISSM